MRAVGPWAELAQVLDLLPAKPAGQRQEQHDEETANDDFEHYRQWSVVSGQWSEKAMCQLATDHQLLTTDHRLLSGRAASR